MAAQETKIVITAEDKASAALNSIKSGLGGVQAGVAALGVSLSAGAFVAYIKGAIDAADHLNDLSQQVGINVEELAKWKLAADQSGTSLEAIAKGIKNLGSYYKEHSDRLRAAGITATDANGIMIQLSDVFASMPDGIEKTSLATALFGKAGMELIPMLNGGSAGMAEAAEKSAKLAAELKVLAPDADKFNDQLSVMKIRSEATAASLAGPLVSGINATMNSFIEARKAGLGFLESLTGFGVRGINESVQEAKDNAGKHIKELMAEREKYQKMLAEDPAYKYKTPDDDRKSKYEIQEIEKRLAYYRALQSQTVNQADYSHEGGKFGAGANAAAILNPSSKAAEIADAASAYDQLNKKISEKLAVEKADLEGQAPIAAWEKTRIELQTALAFASGKLTAAEKADLQAKIEQTVALQESNDTRNAYLKQQKEIAEQREKAIKAITDEAEKLEQEVATYGLTAGQIAATTLARLEDERAMKDSTNTSQEVLDYLDKEIAARKRVAAAAAQKDVLDANSKAAEEAKKDWEKVSDDINRSLTDAILNGGKSGGELIQDYFKTLVLRPIIQAVTAPAVNAIGQALGMGGAAGGGGVGGAGGYNPLSGSFSAGNTGFAGLWSSAPVNSWTNFGFSGVGESLGLSTTVGEGVKQLTSAGEWLSANGASALGYAGALYSLSQGNYGSAAGSAIGTYIMPGIGTAIGSVLGGLLDGGGEDPHNNADSTGYAFKLTKSGVMGTGTGAGITDEVPANIPYSWVAGQTSGRGRWNDGTALDAATIAQITQASAAVFASGSEMAKILGLDSSVINSASVSSTGFKSVEDALGQLSDDIALKLVPNLKQFQNAGQTLWQTLQNDVAAVTAMKKSFEDFKASLNMSDLSTLDPLGKYRLAKDLYNQALSSGDGAAITANAQQFLTASRTAFGSTAAYATDYQAVLDSVTQLETQVAQYPWLKAGTATAAPQVSTPANDALVSNTQATVTVLQSGLTQIVAALQAQGETLAEIQRKLGLQLAAA